MRHKKHRNNVDGRIIFWGVLIVFVIALFVYGSDIFSVTKKSLVNLRGETIEIEWSSATGYKCWEFNKKTNLMSLDVIRECRDACNKGYHLISEDYLCDIDTGIVTCICTKS